MTEQLPPRLPNEPEAAYQRFLSYCKLGMGRSVRAAYAAYREELEGSHEGQQDTKRPRPPGQWQRQSVRFRWRERACEWDIRRLTEEGNRLAEELARRFMPPGPEEISYPKPRLPRPRRPRKVKTSEKVERPPFTLLDFLPKPNPRTSTN
jgi:hypothetical protein